jgi:predicted DNA-binding transcriptional regulator AlpA
MTIQDQLLASREAAQLLGISYPTVKHWILERKAEDG